MLSLKSLREIHDVTVCRKKKEIDSSEEFRLNNKYIHSFIPDYQNNRNFPLNVTIKWSNIQYFQTFIIDWCDVASYVYNCSLT